MLHENSNVKPNKIFKKTPIQSGSIMWVSIFLFFICLDFCKIVIKPTMLYGVECLEIKRAYKQKIKVIEMRMLR